MAIKNIENGLILKQYTKITPRVARFVSPTGEGSFTFLEKYVYPGKQIGDFPTVTVTGNRDLVGWFDAEEGGNQITDGPSRTMPDEDVTFYAQFGDKLIYWAQEDNETKTVRLSNEPYDAANYLKTGSTDFVFDVESGMPWSTPNNLTMVVDKKITPICKVSDTSRRLSRFLYMVNSVENITNFDFRYINNLYRAFRACYVSPLNLSDFNFNTDYITSFEEVFRVCGSKVVNVSLPNSTKLTNCYHMFYEASKIEEINLNINTSNVTNMEGMFLGCWGVTNISGLSKFNTSKVTTMRQMFYNCNALESVNLNSFDTSKVTSFESMFQYCSTLPSIDCSSFITSKAVDTKVTAYDTIYGFKSMFEGCKAASSIIVSRFQTGGIGSFHSMFKNCKELTSLNLTTFTAMTASPDGPAITHMFNGCAKLQTIRVMPVLFEYPQIKYGNEAFKGCTSLTGDNGSTISTVGYNVDAAVIDTESTPGLLSNGS